MKIVIVGGHLSPALAVIEALPKDAEVLFIGRKYVFEGDGTTSLEYETIKERNIPFTTSNVAFAGVSTGRLQRRFTQHTIPSLFKIPNGIIRSFFILKSFKPDVVLSFGGYLSIPVGIASYLLSISLVIHEQTLEAGVANKILSILAKKICISWSTSYKYFPKNKTVLTGNPMRRFKIYDLRFKIAKEDQKLPLIYITGGSAGSHFINALVEGCLKELLEKFVIIHQTGDAQEYRDFDRLNKLNNSFPSRLRARYRIVKFVDPQEVGSILRKSDLVIGRSGINTITELIFFDKPSLLIPLPYSQNNEQVKNALFFRNKGLGEILYQTEDLSSNKLLEVLMKMLDNIDKYRRDGRFWSNQNDHRNSAQKIVEVVYNETKTKRKQTW